MNFLRDKEIESSTEMLNLEKHVSSSALKAR